MKKLIVLLALAISFQSSAQGLYFPPTTGTVWDTLSASSLGWCDQYLDTLDNYLAQESSDAFILLKDGKIVHEKYFGTFTMDSSHVWNSAGKVMTAFAVGLAQQENLLSINDKTSDYLGTSWTVAPLAKENQITLKHQLSMSSGLDDGVADIFCTDDTCLQYLNDAGTRWAYHNGPYTLLQAVLDSATGKTPSLYLRQKLKNITGITGLYIPIAYNKIFYSKPRSMARFGTLMLNKGNWNGTQIMTDTNYYNQMINTSQSINPAYGYLWWLNGKSKFMLPQTQTVFPGKLYPDAPDDMYAALGKANQLLVVVPSKNIVFIRMGKSGSSNLVGPQMVNQIWKILDKLMCAPNAIANIEKKVEVKIYPNPTNDIIKIESTSKVQSLNLYSLTGKQIMQSDDSKELNITSLDKGIYLLKVQTPNGVLVRKIIKE